MIASINVGKVQNDQLHGKFEENLLSVDSTSNWIFIDKRGKKKKLVYPITEIQTFIKITFKLPWDENYHEISGISKRRIKKYWWTIIPTKYWNKYLTAPIRNKIQLLNRILNEKKNI